MFLIVCKSKDTDLSIFDNCIEYEYYTVRDLLNINIDINKYTALIILGGDGTIIRTLHNFRNVPVVYAVNYGNLGFLAPFKREDIKKLSLNLKNNVYMPFLTRKRLFCSIGKYFINEIVFLSKGFGLNRFLLTINGNQINLEGDSVIISTMSGSTGYNFSAGGPILLVENIVINLVSPNKINFRPIVCGLNSEIHVKTMCEDPIVIIDSVQYEGDDFVVKYDGSDVNFKHFDNYKQCNYIKDLMIYR